MLSMALWVPENFFNETKEHLCYLENHFSSESSLDFGLIWERQRRCGETGSTVGEEAFRGILFDAQMPAVSKQRQASCCVIPVPRIPVKGVHCLTG